MRNNSYWSLLKNYHFLKLWGSQIFSQLTIYTINFLLIDRVYTTTSSTLAVALIWFSYGLPAAVVGLFSGVLIDSWGKKRVLVISNLIQALIVLSYALLGKKFYLLYFLVFCYSLVNQFYLPAEGASLPWLVKKRLLPSANSLFVLTTQIAFLLGFGSGGLVINLFSEQGTILLGSLLLLSAGLLCLSLPQEKILSSTNKTERFLESFAKQISSGWAYLLSKGRLVLISFLILLLFQTIVTSFASILPALSDVLLSLPLKESGPWLILPLSFGLFLGSYIFSHFARKKRKKQWINIGLLSTSIIILLVIYIPHLITKIFAKKIVTSLLLLLLGIFSSMISVPAQTFIQETTPPMLRGRVFGILNSIVNFGSVFLVLIISALIDILGITSFLVVIGIGGIILSWFIFRRSDEIIVAANNRH